MRIHSLTTRFLLTLLLSTALPFLVFGWYARSQMESRLDSQVVQVFLPDQAVAAAEQITARLHRFKQGCGTLRNELMGHLRQGDVGDFDMKVDLTPDFDPDVVLLVGADGVVLRSKLHPRLDSKTRDASERLLPASVADAPWYRAIAGGQGEVWEDRHLSPYLHKTPERTSQDPDDYSLGLAYHVPTAEPGQHGAVYCLIRWSEVQGVLDKTAEFLRNKARFASAQVFLCDEKGSYLAHTNRAKYAPGASLPDVLRAALPHEGGAVEGAFAGDGGEDRRAGLAAVGFPDVEWWVGLDAKTDELLATSRELSDVLLLVTGVTALILVAWATVASRAILRPVRRLAEATEAVARGDLSVRVPARGRHEIAELGRAFNRMAEDLDRNERQLRKAERQAAWAEMARQIAHEIKNPLTPLRMSAQMLLRAKQASDERLPELTDRLARAVLQQTDALSKIASDFRQFAGPPSRKLELVAADDLLRDVEEFFGGMAEAGRVELSFAPNAGAARVLVDREELRRVFFNLLHNAFAACGERSRVAVSSQQVEDRVVFRVEDNGTGIDAETRARLFDPYFTTKSSGTGLGLAICRRILEAYSGQIELESSVPGRTVFRFELPAG